MGDLGRNEVGAHHLPRRGGFPTGYPRIPGSNRYQRNMPDLPFKPEGMSLERGGQNPGSEAGFKGGVSMGDDKTFHPSSDPLRLPTCLTKAPYVLNLAPNPLPDSRDPPHLWFSFEQMIRRLMQNRLKSSPTPFRFFFPCFSGSSPTHLRVRVRVRVRLS